MSKRLSFLLAGILLISSTPIFADEIMPLTDDELYTINYNPGNTNSQLIVQISYKISITSSGNYYPSITGYDCTGVEDIFGTIHYFRIESCTISSKTESGFTTRLMGYYETYNSGSGILTYSDLRSYYIYNAY